MMNPWAPLQRWVTCPALEVILACWQWRTPTLGHLMSLGLGGLLPTLEIDYWSDWGKLFLLGYREHTEPDFVRKDIAFS